MADFIALDAALKEIERFAGYLDDDMIYRIKSALKRIDSVSITHPGTSSPDFPFPMRFVPNKERYSLLKVDGTYFLPLYQVIGDLGEPKCRRGYLGDDNKWHPECEE